VVAGVDGAELGGHVAAAAPLQGGEIGGVGHGEVVEGSEQMARMSASFDRLDGKQRVYLKGNESTLKNRIKLARYHNHLKISNQQAIRRYKWI
jgi:hypothetical protein